jgi:xanthine dehydrogenase/oxidase
MTTGALPPSALDSADQNLALGLARDYATDLGFFLNGKEVRIRGLDPDLLLIDYLRDPAVGLTGTKKGCGDGGCGACTVVLSWYSKQRRRVFHRAVNACLRRLAALDGMAVTTVEGLTIEGKISPIQHRLVEHNGTQCGYCTPGFVMTMHAFMADRPAEAPRTAREIESLFQGNICRCTGYRPILDAMKTFASDWSASDQSMACLPPPGQHVSAYAAPQSHFPEEWKGRVPIPVRFSNGHHHWVRPVHLDELRRLWKAGLEWGTVRLSSGGTTLRLLEEKPAAGATTLTLDISAIEELQDARIADDELILGGALTYADTVEFLHDAAATLSPAQARPIRALLRAAERTAGHQVRNAATLAGNTVLVARLASGGRRFASDMVAALAGMGAVVEFASLSGERQRELGLLELLEELRTDDRLQQDLLIQRYRVRLGRDENEHATTDRVARRPDDSAAIVNAGFRLGLDQQNRVTQARLVLGGIGLVPIRATGAEQALMGQQWSRELVPACIQALAVDIRTGAQDPAGDWDGISDGYRRHLAEALLFKFLVEVSTRIGKGLVSPRVESAATPTRRPVSAGTQIVPSPDTVGPLGAPYVKEEAFLQVTGEARYTHDLPLPPRGLHAAFVTSARALAHFDHALPQAPERPAQLAELCTYLRQAFPGFVDYITAASHAALTMPASDAASYDPLLANGLVTCFGQPIGLVVAESESAALEIAEFVGSRCVNYRPLAEGGVVRPVVVSIEEARERPDGIMRDTPPYPVHIAGVTRPGSRFEWTAAPHGAEATVNGVRCVVVHGAMATATQAHFYLETQGCLAIPGERSHLLMHSSSQWLAGVHEGIRSTLGLDSNAITVRVNRLGGGYGGKTTRTPFVASPVAYAAWKLNRPVRLALPRAVDSAMIGKRHPFYGEFHVAIATGTDDDPSQAGRIMGLATDLWADGGNSYDCSFNVLDCAQLQGDACYLIPNYRTTGEVCRTNTASNNAMRSYGMLQAMLIQEEALEAAAHAAGIGPERVRRAALYRRGDHTPAGQKLDYCSLSRIWSRLERQAKFRARLKEVDAFNRRNLWRKRGISMMPLKYGMGFYASFLEQGGALVEVFQSDGRVLIRHGGVEMGQGVLTKLAQLAAATLNVPMELIRTDEADTHVIADPISTGGSTGTQLNGGAAREACRALRTRLEKFCEALRHQHGEDWCREQHINYWDYPKGWAAQAPPEKDGGKLIWQYITELAFNLRVNLSAQARFHNRGTPYPHGLSYHEGVTEEVDQFEGFTYAAACSEVEVDVLTGETTVLRSDILYDMGTCLNPAIDLGQIEGGFIMGLGHILTEQVVVEPSGERKGVVTTLNTMDYKPPTVGTIPLKLNVDLYPRRAGTNPHLRYDSRREPPALSSKGVGEPPLVLSASVYFALKHAILAARRDRGHDEWFRLDTPATVERVREACLFESGDLTLDPKAKQ